MTSRKGTIPYEGRITADCHIHTEFSSDSETKITDQVERAIALGLDHICFTDHMDMDYPEGEFELDTDAYVKTGTGATGRIQRPDPHLPWCGTGHAGASERTPAGLH